MRVEPVSTPVLIDDRDPERWKITERRVIVVDGVVVHYAVAQKHARDANGVIQRYAAVTLQWPTGERTIPASGFTPAMTDAQLRVKVRDAMKAR